MERSGLAEATVRNLMFTHGQHIFVIGRAFLTEKRSGIRKETIAGTLTLRTLNLRGYGIAILTLPKRDRS